MHREEEQNTKNGADWIRKNGAPPSPPSIRPTIAHSRSLIRELFTLAGIGAIYFVAAKLGLKLAIVYPSASAVWPGTGIALAAMLLLGHRVWPAIFFGAFLANLTTAGSVATSIGIAIGNTLEAVTGAYLVNRFANGQNVFDRARDILKFVFVVATLSSMISATVGVTSLALGKFMKSEDIGAAWFTWWLGDTIGSIVLTPLIVLWSADFRIRWNFNRTLEAALFLVSFVFVCLVVFGGLVPISEKNYPLEFLCVPFFFWTAFRFGQRETAAAVAVLGAIAIWGTLHDYGPFAMRSAGESLLLLQAFLGVKSVMSLVIATIVTENRRVETQLLHLSVTDPLTGLANYRKFMDTLDREINRARRTERSFAILFLDVDELKLINDKRGHIAGNQALCRVANAMRGSCRSIDTIARFGGDEFAVILSEADYHAAQVVAGRIATRLSAADEGPAVSVSVGVAVFPIDGERMEALISAADGGLYCAKARGRAERMENG